MKKRKMWFTYLGGRKMALALLSLSSTLFVYLYFGSISTEWITTITIVNGLYGVANVSQKATQKDFTILPDFDTDKLES